MAKILEVLTQAGRVLTFERGGLKFRLRGSQAQLVSGSFMDYTMPRADNLVNISVGTENTLCTHNPLGVKGCGEVGAIGSPPAVINAVVNALSAYGVRHMNMPASPEKVWNIIHGGQRAAAE